jgi:hypothetical protein
MTISARSRSLYLIASLAAGCAGSAAELGTASTTTPLPAAVGEPTAELSPEGALVTSLPPPEPAEPEPETPLPMFGAALILKVKDFDAWKTAFDAGLATRKQAGFAAHGITRGVDNAQQVMVWLAVTDVVKAKAFFADKQLRQKMKEAGVEGKPEIHLWSNVAAKMDPGQRDLSAALIIARLAKDVAAFKPMFDATEQARTDAGIAGYSLSQDVDDKSTAYLYLQSEDAAKLKLYLDAKATKQSWRDAGVKGTPAVTLVREGEMTTYQ